jgi:hypothetical protein
MQQHSSFDREESFVYPRIIKQGGTGKIWITLLELKLLFETFRALIQITNLCVIVRLQALHCIIMIARCHAYPRTMAFLEVD